MNDETQNQTDQANELKQMDDEIRSFIESQGVDVYLYSGKINETGYAIFHDKLIETLSMQPKPAGKTNTKALLILSTTGGYPKEGFKIANQLLNKAYPDGFDIYIPGQCKSTGTMIALGANCLFMNQFSELGPLDIQLLDRENLGFRRSGLDYKYVFESLGPEFSKLFVAQTLQIRQQSDFVLTTKQAAEYAAEFVTASMKSVFEQLNPLDISRDYRDLMIMKKYGNFLAEKSGNISADSIDKLINDYPSHDYVIDDIEAKKII